MRRSAGRARASSCATLLLAAQILRPRLAPIAHRRLTRSSNRQLYTLYMNRDPTRGRLLRPRVAMGRAGVAPPPQDPSHDDDQTQSRPRHHTRRQSPLLALPRTVTRTRRRWGANLPVGRLFGHGRHWGCGRRLGSLRTIRWPLTHAQGGQVRVAGGGLGRSGNRQGVCATRAAWRARGSGRRTPPVSHWKRLGKLSRSFCQRSLKPIASTEGPNETLVGRGRPGWLGRRPSTERRLRFVVKQIQVCYTQVLNT